MDELAHLSVYHQQHDRQQQAALVKQEVDAQTSAQATLESSMTTPMSAAALYPALGHGTYDTLCRSPWVGSNGQQSTLHSTASADESSRLVHVNNCVVVLTTMAAAAVVAAAVRSVRRFGALAQLVSPSEPRRRRSAIRGNYFWSVPHNKRRPPASVVRR
uniref:Uncharacterized protein n=1 Tax=Plectus sambesii TaxID=2011161 RepID=A0A914W031_9BILA